MTTPQGPNLLTSSHDVVDDDHNNNAANDDDDDDDDNAAKHDDVVDDDDHSNNAANHGATEPPPSPPARDVGVSPKPVEIRVALDKPSRNRKISRTVTVDAGDDTGKKIRMITRVRSRNKCLRDNDVKGYAVNMNDGGTVVYLGQSRAPPPRARRGRRAAPRARRARARARVTS